MMEKNYKELFENLFKELYNNKFIYHERITFLCSLINVSITENDYQVEFKIIKPLSDVSYYRHFYQNILAMPSINVGGGFSFGNILPYDGKKIGGGYSPLIWVNPEIVKQFCEANENEYAEMIDTLFWA